MMNTPLARAFSSSAFIRGANSASRFTAFLQWCRSHMSQTMIAVFRGSQRSLVVTAVNSPDPGRDSTRFCRVNSSEDGTDSAAMGDGSNPSANVSPSKANHPEVELGMPRQSASDDRSQFGLWATPVRQKIDVASVCGRIILLAAL